MCWRINSTGDRTVNVGILFGRRPALRTASLALTGLVLASLLSACDDGGIPTEPGAGNSATKSIQVASESNDQKADKERTEFCVKGQFLDALYKNSNRKGRLDWQHDGTKFSDIEPELNAALKNYTPKVESQLEGFCNLKWTMNRATATRVCKEVRSQNLLFWFADTDLRTTDEVFYKLVEDHNPMLICAGIRNPQSSYYDFTD